MLPYHTMGDFTRIVKKNRNRPLEDGFLDRHCILYCVALVRLLSGEETLKAHTAGDLF